MNDRRQAFDVRPVARGDVAAVGDLLGRAFADNPAYLAILAHLSDAKRALAVKRIKRGFTRAAVSGGQAEAVWVEGKPAAAALCFAPGQYPVSIAAYLWRASGCLGVGPLGLWRLLRSDAYLSARHLREPHHYLFVLGAEPAQQGRGLGGALLRRLSARADADQVACYLETDKEQNLRIYEAHGYRVLTDELVRGVPGLRFWTMRRPSSTEHGAR
jgi:ribosomal protein S18 acetylase RimI-like enzyme